MKKEYLETMLKIARENENFEDVSRIIKVGKMNGINLQDTCVFEQTCVNCGCRFTTTQKGVNYCTRCHFNVYDRY